MNKTASKKAASVLVALLTVSAGIGCGFVASVPWIRSADRNGVVNLGDSIFALSGEIQGFLHSYAGKTFRRYATSGAEINGGDLIAPSVYNQYAIARADYPSIQTILMDGGGNDILLPVITLFDPYDCKTEWYQWWGLSSSCKSLINDIYVDAANLLNDMYARGVGKVIYLGYYYTKNSIFGNLADLRKAIDYGDTKMAQACAYSAVSCSFVDPRSYITNSDIISDGIHPTTSGSLKIANKIWPLLAPRL